VKAVLTTKPGKKPDATLTLSRATLNNIVLRLSKHSMDLGSPLPNAGEGSCEKIENRLLPALSVRRRTAVPRARATQVERALRARFHLWTRRRDGSGWLNSIFSQLQGLGGEGASK